MSGVSENPTASSLESEASLSEALSPRNPFRNVVAHKDGGESNAELHDYMRSISIEPHRSASSSPTPTPRPRRSSEASEASTVASVSMARSSHMQESAGSFRHNVLSFDDLADQPVAKTGAPKTSATVSKNIKGKRCSSIIISSVQRLSPVDGWQRLLRRLARGAIRPVGGHIGGQ